MMKLAISSFLLAPVFGMNHRGAMLMNEKVSYWNNKVASGEWPRAELSTVKNQAVTCTGTSVLVDGERFPCENIDFLSFISLNDLNINGRTTQGSDIWGWRSPTGREITIMCVDNGVWFVDGTDPEDPVILANLPSGRSQAPWCDVKVYQDTAYIVKDQSGGNTPSNYGIEVFNLNRLNSLTGSSVVTLSPDTVYRQHGRSHNVVVDTESGFLYSVGTTTCSGGLHAVDIRSPLNPTFAGCISADGYTHDAQCVVYRGPDSTYTGRQICFAYNEDTVTIWDVTSKSNPVILSRTGYTNSRYTHQGWLTADFRYVLVDDELDERDSSAVQTTTTYIFDVSDLNNPTLVDRVAQPEVSVDHNLYVWGAIHERGWGGNGPLSNPPDDRYAYLSNYVAGIKVLDVSNPLNAQIVGQFDVAPDITGNVFEGTWSNYMHPSGVLAVSSIDRGLFFLRPQMAFGGSTPTSGPAPTPDSSCQDLSPSGITVGGVPTPCDQLGIYCAGYDFVRDRCPETCGLCAAGISVSGADTSEVFDLPAESNITTILLFVVGGLCVTLVGVIAVFVRRLRQVPKEEETSVAALEKGESL